MESGDGLLVRVRARRGARGIRASEVRALAQLAVAHGNGLLEVTRRARLQLRGVRAESLAALQRAVVDLGLAYEAQASERSADALIVNPWSGLAPACAQLDAIAAEIEAALAHGGVCEGASDKLAIVLDSGYALMEIAADIHVNLEPRRANRAQIHVAAGTARWAQLGECDVANVPAVLVTLLSALRDSRVSKRMRDLVETLGLEPLRERALALGLIAPCGSRSAEETLPLPSTSVDAPEWLELHLPFGSGDRMAWDQLALAAEQYGTGEVRVTPFRSVILPGVASAHRTTALAIAVAAGFITDASAPLLRVAACPGAPACSAANGETRGLARELAAHLGAGETLHVSGCPKGCAQSAAASVTLVHRTHGCSLGFGVTAAQTAELPLLAIDAARAAVRRHSLHSHARALARDPSTVQARELS